MRRWIYNTLAPLDRGEFKWEFLVPWTNKTLTSADKFIVCSTFIGLSFTIQTLADPGASVGVHLSYIAQFFSYAMGDPIGFRALAVLTALLEIGGNLFETKETGAIVAGVDFDLAKAFANVNVEDVFPILYDQLFVKHAANAYARNASTPWHADGSYWAVRGKQIASVAIALDDHDAPNSLAFSVGSHLTEGDLAPVQFATGERYARGELGLAP